MQGPYLGRRPLVAMSSPERLSPVDDSAGWRARNAPEVRPSVNRRRMTRSLSRHLSNASSEPRKKKVTADTGVRRGPYIGRRRSSPSPVRKPRIRSRSRSRSPRKALSRPSTQIALASRMPSMRARSAPADRSDRTCSYCFKPLAYEQRARGFLLMHEECAKGRRAENDKFRDEEIIRINL